MYIILTLQSADMGVKGAAYCKSSVPREERSIDTCKLHIGGE